MLVRDAQRRCCGCLGASGDRSHNWLSFYVSSPVTSVTLPPASEYHFLCLRKRLANNSTNSSNFPSPPHITRPQSMALVSDQVKGSEVHWKSLVVLLHTEYWPVTSPIVARGPWGTAMNCLPAYSQQYWVSQMLFIFWNYAHCPLTELWPSLINGILRGQRYPVLIWIIFVDICRAIMINFCILVSVIKSYHSFKVHPSF